MDFFGGGNNYADFSSPPLYGKKSAKWYFSFCFKTIKLFWGQLSEGTLSFPSNGTFYIESRLRSTPVELLWLDLVDYHRAFSTAHFQPPPPPHHPDRLQLTPLGAFSPQPLPTSCALIGSPVVLAEDGSTNQKPPFRPHNGLAEAIVWTCLMKVLSSGNLGVVARIGLCRIFWAPTGVLAGWGLGEIKAPPFLRASQTDSTLKIFKPAKLKHLSRYRDHYEAMPKFKLIIQDQKHKSKNCPGVYFGKNAACSYTNVPNLPLVVCLA